MKHYTIKKESEVTEEPGTNQESETDAGVILVIVQHVLSIAVIVLEHDELVGIMINAVS